MSFIVKLGVGQPLKTLWAEWIFHLYESMNIEDKNPFLVKCLAYTHIKFQFQIFFSNIELFNLLASQNYNKPETFIFKLFEYKNNICKQIK